MSILELFLQQGRFRCWAQEMAAGLHMRYIMKSMGQPILMEQRQVLGICIPWSGNNLKVEKE